MNKAAMLATGIGIGGGLAFLLDPNSGRRRRALVRDKMVSAWNDTEEAAEKTSRDLANRARGAVAATRSIFGSEEASDDVLVARVRSRIGHVTSHPGAIEITASQGTITLSGPVLAGEVGDLMKAASAVRGVERIVNHLEVHESAENVPGLQGAAARPDRNFSPVWRAAAGVAGGALAVYGWRNRRTIRKAATAAGFLAGVVANRGVRRLIRLAA